MNTRRGLVSLLTVSICGCASAPADGATSASEPPTIVQQPISQHGKPFGSVRFTVTASGSPPLTYQWRRDGMTWPEWNQRSITLPALTENDIGNYTVTVSNAAGSVTSDPVQLTVAGSPPPSMVPRPPPTTATPKVIAPKPPETAAKNYVVVGKTVRLVASAEGAPPFKFQWRKNGGNIAGATVAVLVIENAREADSGIYTCMVSNSAGSSASHPVTLVVRPP